MRQQVIKEETVLEEVKKAIADTLNIDMVQITPQSSLIRDLGAESLDFLDINYRLEQAFGIKMARHFVLEHVEEMFGEGTAIDENSQLTDRAVTLLKNRLGEELAGELRPGMDMDEVPAIVTVQSLTRGVMDILDSLPEKCGSCGSSAWQSDDGLHTKCGSCGEAAAFANGDDLIRAWVARVQEEKQIF